MLFRALLLANSAVTLTFDQDIPTLVVVDGLSTNVVNVTL